VGGGNSGKESRRHCWTFFFVLLSRDSLKFAGSRSESWGADVSMKSSPTESSANRLKSLTLRVLDVFCFSDSATTRRMLDSPAQWIWLKGLLMSTRIRDERLRQCRNDTYTGQYCQVPSAATAFLPTQDSASWRHVL